MRTRGKLFSAKFVCVLMCDDSKPVIDARQSTSPSPAQDLQKVPVFLYYLPMTRESENEAPKINPLAEILRRARLKTGISQADAAEVFKVRREAVAQWEREKGNPPSATRFDEIAKLYNMDTQLLYDAREPGATQRTAQPTALHFKHGQRPVLNYFPLPCLSRLPRPDEDIRDLIIRSIANPHILWRILAVPCSEKSFFIQMQGASMEPRIPDKTWIAIDPAITPRHESIVLTRGERDAPDIKQLTIDGGTWFLTPENRTYPVRKITKEDILGVAIEGHILF
jgi:transcriptional regulator with XRE-family HTH domain